jgi:hypothetical protein
MSKEDSLLPQSFLQTPPPTGRYRHHCPARVSEERQEQNDSLA